MSGRSGPRRTERKGSEGAWEEIRLKKADWTQKPLNVGSGILERLICWENSCGALEWEHLHIFSQKYQYVDIPNLSWVFYIIYAIDTVIPSKSEVLNNGTRLAPGILDKKLWTYW